MHHAREIEVFDMPSNLGGTFTVSIEEEIDAETVSARIWHGRATVHGWEAWPAWHGIVFPVRRALLKNRRSLALYSERD
ncbi:hypothetical protein [Agrobacterium larrymoorei]|uniref:Uncharacterized protein n=1 Tax=Agrobacterium larrymoorei TaxID=160699 RepID=A0ABX8TC39_9HYPH|nr:hypothetical protein [Agrobacterium larrymoorei]QYA10813.1 hypothetical protein J5285_26020 [Agrobacterium larrymoorei]